MLLAFFVQNLVTSVFQSLWFTLPQVSGLDLEKELQKRVLDIMDVVRPACSGVCVCVCGRNACVACCTCGLFVCYRYSMYVCQSEYMCVCVLCVCLSVCVCACSDFQISVDDVVHEFFEQLLHQVCMCVCV